MHSLGFQLIATRGTAAALEAGGVPAEAVFKVNEGRPNIVDLVKTGNVDLIINTPLGRESFYDEKSIRRAAIRYKRSLHHHAFRRASRRARHPRAGRASL